MNSDYLLVLAALYPDCTDPSGTLYPEYGVLECDCYQPGPRIDTGLSGVLWGRIAASDDRRLFSGRNVYAVMSVRQTSELEVLDRKLGLVKFRNGMVIYRGTLEECGRRIAEYCSKHHPLDAPVVCSSVAGVPVKTKGAHALSTSFGASARTEGDACHAIVASCQAAAEAYGEDACAVALANDCSASSQGTASLAFCSRHRCRAEALSYGGMAVAAGDNSEAVAGEDGTAFCLGIGGRAAVGEGGTLGLVYYDGQRPLMLVGVAGVDIEPGVMYEASEGFFVRVEPSGSLETSTAS